MIKLRPILTRRTFLAGLGTVTMLSSGAGFASPSDNPGYKLIIVILRGALDGLSAVQPKDSQTRKLRPDLISQNALSLNSLFELNRSLGNLGKFYHSGEAAIIHAIAGPWRDRSHFLAQDLLESGSAEKVLKEGWLNRALQVSPIPLKAVSIGTSSPLILQGTAPFDSWSPSILPEVDDDTINRLSEMYSNDRVLDSALKNAVALNQKLMPKQPGRRDSTPLAAAARLLKKGATADIAVISLTGWDTHDNQLGRLERRLSQLDAGLKTLKEELGSVWKKTMIAVVTEFGRTVRQNGTRGTDHGTASVAFVLGGRVRGGRVLGAWPGLSPNRLYENRDLYPANNLTALFKGLLRDQFGFGFVDLTHHVFSGQKIDPVSLT